MTHSPFPTEEDVRSRILLPFLESVGISPARISLEKTLKLRVGRTVVTVDGDRRDSVSGRLDVLVKDDEGNNLFVVELKAEGSDLTNEDRDQGVSYARLLHPMAPFVLVTNGRQSQLFDTITREPITASTSRERLGQWRSGHLSATTENLNIRYEALKHFLGYSRENVREFCRGQQERSLVALRGDGKKYIPRLHVERGIVKTALERFIRSDSVAFALVGDSGVGKTCQICASAEGLAQNDLVLFWNGAELVGSLAGTIADEFSWHFSEELSPPKIADRLAEVAQATKRRVVLVIDAVDESGLPDAPREVSELVRRLATHEGLIKLVLSLKTSEWHRFALIRGNPSQLVEELFRNTGIAGPSTDPTLTASAPAPSVVLTQFDEPERDAAINKYRGAFRIQSPFEGDLLGTIRDPLLLRLVCETFAGRVDPLPPDIGHEMLLQRYLDERVNKTSHPSGVEKAIIATARTLATFAQETSENALVTTIGSNAPEEAVRGMDPTVTDVALQEAVAFGVLSAVEDPHGRRRLGFTYDRVRDYVMAFRVLDLDTLSATAFRRLLPNLLDRSPTRSAATWYLRNATPDQWAATMELVAERVVLFVQVYAQLVSYLGPTLRKCVDPHTPGPMAAVFEVDRHGGWTLGLFPRQPGQMTVAAREGWLADWFAARGDERRFPLRVSKARSGTDFDLIVEPKKRAAQYLLEELRKAVHDGGMDDSRSRLLMLEQVFGLIDANRSLLKPNRHARARGVAEVQLPTDLLPIDVGALRDVINERFGEEYFKDQFTQNELRKLVEQARAEGRELGIVSISIGSEVLADCRAQALREARSGRRFPVPRVRDYPPVDLLQALDSLGLRRGKIRHYHLPLPDQSSQTRAFESGYSDAQLTRFLEEFFGHVLAEYKQVVTVSFGMLAPALNLYARLPVVALVEYFRPEGDTSDFDPSSQLIYSFVKTAIGRRNRVDVRVEPDRSVFRNRLHAMARGDDVPSDVETRYGRASCSNTHFGSFGSIVQPNRERALRCGGHARPPRGLWIREWIYDLVEDDLRSLDADRLLGLLRKDGKVSGALTRFVNRALSVLRDWGKAL